MAEYTVVIDLDFGRVKRELAAFEDAFRRLEEMLTPRHRQIDVKMQQAVLRSQVMRQCAGMRRRQIRRRR